jgi:hypothetical protein
MASASRRTHDSQDERKHRRIHVPCLHGGHHHENGPIHPGDAVIVPVVALGAGGEPALAEGWLVAVESRAHDEGSREGL